jgi:hypothetical protein
MKADLKPTSCTDLLEERHNHVGDPFRQEYSFRSGMQTGHDDLAEFRLPRRCMISDGLLNDVFEKFNDLARQVEAPYLYGSR